MAVIVQSAVGTNTNVSGNPTTATLGATPSDGNYILVIYMGGQSVPQDGAMAAQEDPLGTPDETGWTEIVNAAANGTSQPYSYRFAAYRAYTTGDSLTYGVDYGTADAGAVFVLELDEAQLDTADLLEATNSAFNSSNGATSLNTGNVTTASDQAIIFAAIHLWNTNGDQNFTHSANWTEEFDVADDSGGATNEMNAALVWREESANGTFSNTFSWTNGGTFGSGHALIFALNTLTTNVQTSGIINGGGGISATVTAQTNQIIRPTSTVTTGTWDTGPTAGQALHTYAGDDSDATYIFD